MGFKNVFPVSRRYMVANYRRVFNDRIKQVGE